MNKTQRILKKINKRNFNVYKKSFSCYFDPNYDLLKWKRRIVVIHGLVDEKKYPHYCISSDDYRNIDGYGYYKNTWYYFNIMSVSSLSSANDNCGVNCYIKQAEYRSYCYLRYSFTVTTNKYPLLSLELALVLTYLERWLDSNLQQYSYFSPMFRHSYKHCIEIVNDDILNG